MGYVIGLDLGTQSMKGILSDPLGNTVATAACSHNPIYPAPGYAEQDVDEWIVSLKTVIASLLEQSQISAQDIKTMGIAAQVDGVVPVDETGTPLSPAIIWMDRRADSQCRSMANLITPERFLEKTGLNLDATHVAPKLLWFKECLPEVYSRTKKFFVPGSYLLYWLTGQHIIDDSNASSSLLYQIESRKWDREISDVLGLPENILGNLAPAESIAGTLRSDVAKQLGLSPKTKVIVGCGDEHAACLGAGLIRPGMVCDISGTAEPVAVVSATPERDLTGLVETHMHADRRWWLIENPGFVSGGSIRWYLDNIGHCSCQEMDRDAANAAVGCNGLVFLPCLSGAMVPCWNNRAKGAFYGLTASHTTAYLGRAVLEGCSFGLRDCIDRFRQMGMEIGEIRTVGGGARSDVWCQMKADILGHPLQCICQPESTAAGVTMLAHLAEKNFTSLEEAVAVMVKTGKRYEPNPMLYDAYNQAYQRYRKTYFHSELLITE